MTFEEVLNEAVAMLKRQGRVSYRALKRQFDLDDDYLDDLKGEILYTQSDVDEDGDRGLVWTSELVEPSQTAQDETDTKPSTHETSTSQPEPPPRDIQTPEAERRQLTVMFCDLVDSTQLSSQLDPENLREVVRTYQSCATGVIQQYEGYVAQYLGDGLLVYFGWPQAHEDDAHRAVHSALGIVEAIRDLNTTLETDHGLQLAVRLGIHTGPVVVGEMGGDGRQEQLALGETPNIAARLEGLARPGTVVISDDTRRLVAGAFSYESLGTPKLKGISEPIPVFGVRGLGTAASRFEAATTTLRPMVGREAEVALLMQRWEQVQEGEGQVVLLNGPPGIGKSRLLQALSSRLAETPHIRLRYQCSPYHTNSALYPIAAQVTRAMQLPSDATSDAKLDRLEALVAQTGLPIDETVWLFATMLSIPTAGRYPSLSMPPERQKERFLDLFAQGLVSLSRQEPVLVYFEDVHWSDPTSLEALGRVIDQIQDARVLVVLTYRPEFEPTWCDDRHVMSYTLNHLSRRQTVDLVAHVTAGKTLPAEVLDQIVDKTDGIPLFVEELTMHILESEWLLEAGDSYRLTSPSLPLSIPETLQDSLMARLDRLSEVKEVAQLGATIGREFSYGLLRALSPQSDRAIEEALDQLINAELISQRGSVPESTYRFKHALIQDAAYASMLRSTRRHVHQQIARVLETELEETMETLPELVAHHATEGELYEMAVPYWQQAARRATNQSAYQEAAAYFDRAREMLTHLPEKQDTLEWGIDLNRERATIHYIFREHEQQLQCVESALALAETLGEPGRLALVLSGMSNCLLTLGELDRARGAAQRGVELAESTGDPSALVIPALQTGQICRTMGDYCGGREILAKVEPLLHGELNHSRFGRLIYPAISIRTELSGCLAELGEFEPALVLANTSVQVADTLNHAGSLHNAHMGLCYTLLVRGDFHDVIASLEQNLALCRENNWLRWLPRLVGKLGYAYAITGRHAEALPLLNEAIEFAPSTEVWFAVEAYLHLGRQDEAHSAVLQALQLARDRGMQGPEAHMLRLLAMIAIHGDSPQIIQAEGHYHKALALASKLNMRPLQAHCHRGLGTLYRQTQQAEQARTELSTAIEMYRNMEMTFWLPETEAALKDVKG